MGIQTMTSQGGGGGQRSQVQSLGRQGSLYSLTLNEVQNHLGEPLHSMNLEELLKGLDTNQEVDSHADQYASSSGLQRQGSITMPRGLRDKTVDEVWKDIQNGHENKDANDRRSDQERQLTFGEMTLEDFLAKAGVVPEGSLKNANNVMENAAVGPMAGQGSHWLTQHHQQNVMRAYFPGCGVVQPIGVGSGTMMDAMYPEVVSSPTVGAMSEPQTPGRKRGASSDVPDKLVERRQKRMIKNRESAARSRARKQAYTNELENKVSRLEEENERLKKQKELDKILDAPPPEPKYQLRRTSSASF
ncbi:ABSCISIC ACID-INSENSITIVE 5-like protein 2 [Asparagus officinalis]|uniref:ABSCISIC ACID-INSENSITIVE 5-like protein 2 n=1 Tax=Asparagus officinalis TaxID=4686 RepID=UPI00098E2D11|nr:ABSCISIC ACID-INSENSITIVE 5-like protein 2 [Asparagus officinalis]XP_020253621.1 ABSCISIC ACID-INSENSITIVE 5-like protein 2 [Asparagus officinalis]XP_020253622.1 ABSCISIC ACID-INSENSITIVE 5-like protein 2 [Asparagus officinalis]XP_020253623.1 ABSCISIC ACID-INSENSITIVE 5-like protein 2 [Asparagus officinalis]XP_020253624.1 ABSCISIC ACID-INSENSITIVE 5-like protein 2 [Asparagus officinalis]